MSGEVKLKTKIYWKAQYMAQLDEFQFVCFTKNLDGGIEWFVIEREWRTKCDDRACVVQILERMQDTITKFLIQNSK